MQLTGPPCPDLEAGSERPELAGSTPPVERVFCLLSRISKLIAESSTFRIESAAQVILDNGTQVHMGMMVSREARS